MDGIAVDSYGQGRAETGMSAKRRRSGAKSRRGAAMAPAFPRLAWSRSPTQRPHSTKKGARGYDRKRSKKDLRHEREASGG